MRHSTPTDKNWLMGFFGIYLIYLGFIFWFWDSFFGLGLNGIYFGFMGFIREVYRIFSLIYPSVIWWKHTNI